MKKSQKYLISTCIKSTWPKNKRNTLIFSAVSALDKYDGPQSNYKSFRINDYHWKNKKKLGKDFKYLNKYYDDYKPDEMKKKNMYKTRRKYIKFAFGLLLLSGCIYFYNKEN